MSSSSDPPRPRAWLRLQFSLGTVFWLMLVVGMAMVWWRDRSDLGLNPDPSLGSCQPDAPTSLPISITDEQTEAGASG